MRGGSVLQLHNPDENIGVMERESINDKTIVEGQETDIELEEPKVCLEFAQRFHSY